MQKLMGKITDYGVQMQTRGKKFEKALGNYFAGQISADQMAQEVDAFRDWFTGFLDDFKEALLEVNRKGVN